MSQEPKDTSNGTHNTEGAKLNCPTCQKEIHWNDTFPNRPFCSKRCKLIDFGDWASETNTIAGNDLTDDVFTDDL